MTLEDSVQKALSEAGIAASSDNHAVRCRLNGMKFTVKTEVTDLDDRTVDVRSHQSGPASETARSVINVALEKSGLCETDDGGYLIWTYDALELSLS